MGDTGLCRYQRRGAPLNPFSANSISAAFRMSCSLFSFFDIAFGLTILFNTTVNTAKIVLFLKQSKIFLKYQGNRIKF